MKIFIIYFFFNLLINSFFLKYNLLIDKRKLKHKTYTSKASVPISGGFIILISLYFGKSDYLLIYFSSLIFILGIFSDLLIIKSSLKKFIIQFLVVIIFLYLSKLNIHYTKIVFIDFFLENKIFSLFFTLFCLLILINGSNFLDGVNTLVCGYYLLIILALMYVFSRNIILYDIYNLYNLFIALFVIFIFNFFSKTYLGDSGVFLISFIIGYYLINIANEIKIISPYFIVVLLWYPAFENLFSIFRKYLTKSHPASPDNLHLHHLLFYFFKKKIFKKNYFTNSLTGIFINIYNLFIFFISVNFFDNSKYLICVILFNIIFYCCAYFYLKKENKKLQK